MLKLKQEIIIGDRVFVMCVHRDVKVRGTIIECGIDFGVRLDDYHVSYHELGGKVENGHGWWFLKKKVELILNEGFVIITKNV
tara:strand:- start:3487 stop:3735 length:249 start_codon:yes stop_codon:yes gene_type:complete